jgi:predicted ferric reductase
MKRNEIYSYNLALLVSFMLLLTLALDAHCRPFRLEKLPDKGESFDCNTCHINYGKEKNLFGKDYEAIAIPAGDIYTEELGNMDSDGDGFTNDEEFLAKTNPGDPESKPAKKDNQQTKQDNKTINNLQENKIEPKKENEPVTSEKKEVVLQTKIPELSKTTIPELKSDDSTIDQQIISAQMHDLRKTANIKHYIYKIGRYVSLSGFFLIFIQYILSSKIRFIDRLFGLDKLFLVHRKIGIIGLVFVLTHPILLFIVFGMGGYSLLWKGIGALALIILIIIAGVAILYAKLHLKYETWKNIHRISYIILPIAFIHSIVLGSDLHKYLWLKTLWYILAGIYLIVMAYKIINWIKVRKHPFKIAGVVQETHDIWSLHFKGKNKNYKPGQFMIVNLKRNGKVSESHPFTISSSPTNDMMSISVKSVGDFTSTIKDTKLSDIAYIDAPYGKFSFLNHDSDNLVFIAGGIGITPFISMLRYIYDKKIQRNITLLWANKSENDIAFKDELQKMESGIPKLKIVHVMSKQDDWQGEKGFVDADKIKRLVKDIDKSQFFICGPPIMMTLVKKDLIKLGVSKSKIHYERFALR